MSQDVNKIIDHLSNEWSGDMALMKKRVAILMEENDRLKVENEELKKDVTKGNKESKK